MASPSPTSSMPPVRSSPPVWLPRAMAGASSLASPMRASRWRRPAPRPPCRRSGHYAARLAAQGYGRCVITRQPYEGFPVASPSPTSSMPPVRSSPPVWLPRAMAGASSLASPMRASRWRRPAPRPPCRRSGHYAARLAAQGYGRCVITRQPYEGFPVASPSPTSSMPPVRPPVRSLNPPVLPPDRPLTPCE